jgi:hypothetical protein
MSHTELVVRMGELGAEGAIPRSYPLCGRPGPGLMISVVWFV